MLQIWHKHRGTDPYCVWTTKRPLSGRALGHVTKFLNFGTPVITFEPIELSASNLAETYITDAYCAYMLINETKPNQTNANRTQTPQVAEVKIY